MQSLRVIFRYTVEKLGFDYWAVSIFRLIMFTSIRASLFSVTWKTQGVHGPLMKLWWLVVTVGQSIVLLKIF